MRIVIAVEFPDEKMREDWAACVAEDNTTQSWEEWVAEQPPSLLDYVSGWDTSGDATFTIVDEADATGLRTGAGS